MTNPSYPRYLELGGGLIFQQPYHTANTRLYAFLFKGEAEALHTLCDRAFNTHPDRLYDYRPITSAFLVIFAELGRINSINGPDRERGWVRELNAGIWMLTGAVKRGQRTSPERVAWYIPHMFVDNPYSLIVGREVYGYPKSLGYFQMPTSVSDADYFKVDTLGWRTYGPEEGTQVWPALEIRRIHGASEESHPRQAPGGNTPVPNREEIELFSPGVLRCIFRHLRQKEVPMLFFRQFRDVSDGSRACYQAIVEAPSQIVGWPKMGRLPGKYELLAHHLDSHPVGRDVGIPLAPRAVRAIASFWAEFNFVNHPGREIQVWRP